MMATLTLGAWLPVQLIFCICVILFSTDSTLDSRPLWELNIFWPGPTSVTSKPSITSKSQSEREMQKERRAIPLSNKIAFQVMTFLIILLVIREDTLCIKHCCHLIHNCLLLPFIIAMITWENLHFLNFKFFFLCDCCVALRGAD